MRDIRKVRVIDKRPYSYILFEADADWVLTFLLGGPMELDVSVKLTEGEVERINEDQNFIDKLISNLKKDKSHCESRKIVPAIWPSKIQ